MEPDSSLPCLQDTRHLSLFRARQIHPTPSHSISLQSTLISPSRVRIGFPSGRFPSGRLRLKCDGTRAETRFRLSAKRTNPLQSAGASVQSTTGSRGVRISGSNAGYTMFRCSVKSTGYPLHSPVSPSLPLPCITVYHHISTGLYQPKPVSNFLLPPSSIR
jgi:hypothetical protein